MSKNNKDNYQDVYFWLGAEGETEEVSEEEFKKRQKEWEGVRPQDTSRG